MLFVVKLENMKIYGFYYCFYIIFVVYKFIKMKVNFIIIFSEEFV